VGRYYYRERVRGRISGMEADWPDKKACQREARAHYPRYRYGRMRLIQLPSPEEVTPILDFSNFSLQSILVYGLKKAHYLVHEYLRELERIEQGERT